MESFYNILKNIKTKKDLDEFKSNINEAIEDREKVLSLLSETKILANSSFGYLKDVMETISLNLLKESEGKRILNRYVNEIKGDKDLQNMYALYESIRRIDENDDLDYFMTGAIGNNFNMQKKTVSEKVRKLGEIVSEAYLVSNKSENVKLPNNDKEFHEAVSYIMENKRTVRNLPEFSNASKVIRKHILENVGEKSQNTISNSIEGLSEEIKATSNKQELFEKYKKECTDKLLENLRFFKDNGDMESYDKIFSIRENLINKKFSDSTSDKDIEKLAEMSKIF